MHKQDIEIVINAKGEVTYQVKGVKGGVRVNTGSGEIEASGDPTGEWKLRTGSGNVTVDFPKQAAFELVAHTSSGSISTDSDHGITLQGTINPRELHGKVNGGGSLVDLSTSSGNIRIR